MFVDHHVILTSNIFGDDRTEAHDVNSFDARQPFGVGDESYQIFRLDAVEGSDRCHTALKILLENLLRTEDGANITADDIRGSPAGIEGRTQQGDPSRQRE